MLTAAWPTSHLVSLPQNPEPSSQHLCQIPSSSNLSLAGLLVLQSAECISSSLGPLGTVQPCPPILPAPLQAGPGSPEGG